ncbi:carbamoyltransferase C-terminal domain-containing protein [Streptomyces sp. KE1]|uniref:carbamoyltransferase family protein n=1 Tax=Streptomyces sp. KE1 TaxID=1638939 RepID=UPI00063E89C7|nr:carbamoyltransferase C-terminal domain-containing protein [Streptomyces sp. KE1]KLI99374.1 carbamoyltransferase [Streptomyces sp. KE1]
MRVLGVNALFHDPACALVIDGRVVAAAEEERFSRRKHGKRPLPFSAWELPELSARWCLQQAGLAPADLDAVAYSYDPGLSAPADELGLDDPWDWLRQDYARQAPGFLAEALPGLSPAKVRFVPHHMAHAASAGMAGPHRDSAVLVLDGRGECGAYLAGHYRDRELTVLATQDLPDSVGLFYEDLTEHLGFLRSSDEFKVMALASYGTPRFADRVRAYAHPEGGGRFRARPVPWREFTPRREPGEPWTQDHADLAASAQQCLEETVLGLARWLHEETGEEALTFAGGVALNCVANTRLYRESPFRDVWVQPAAGDAGTAVGAALHVAREKEPVAPMRTPALGRGWSDEELRRWLETAAVPYEEPEDIAATVADELARDGVVAWFQGRSEFGPRALGHRSLLAHPGRAANLERLNAVKGREEFRPVAPMVLAERAGEIFSGGPLPSPYMLFVHDVAEEWRERVPAVVHVDGTARVQTVDAREEPLVARMLTAFEERTGLPVVVNTSLNTAGRPMVDDPRDALECFGSAPVDLLALGPFAVRRGRFFR